jgi:hypothetical protein
MYSTRIFILIVVCTWRNKKNAEARVSNRVSYTVVTHYNKYVIFINKKIVNVK